MVEDGLICYQLQQVDILLNLSGMVAIHSGIELFRGEAEATPQSTPGTVMRVQITDPWIGSQWFNPGSNGQVWLDFDVVYRAMTQPQAGGISRPNWSW